MRILVRCKAKVAAWWKLAAAAHNVEKIVGHMAAAAAASYVERWVEPVGGICRDRAGTGTVERSYDRWPRAALWIALAVSKGILGPFLL